MKRPIKSGIQSRLHFFISSLGVKNIFEWERQMGFSKDSINKYLDGRNSALGIDRLEIIAITYPWLNIHWLIHGKGSMNINPAKDFQETNKALDRALENNLASLLRHVERVSKLREQIKRP